MENPFTVREIKGLFNEVHEKLDRIEGQTIRTNGRVSLLERWRTGIIMCISLITFIVIPLILYANRLQNDLLRKEIVTDLIDNFEVK